MIPRCLSLIAIVVFIFVGCTTPPEIKQALVDMDTGYVENLQMMQQYRQLVNNIHQRHQDWFKYTRQRLLLDLALRSMTQDFWHPITRDGETISKEEHVDVTAMQLGGPIVQIVNELRLSGLTSQHGSDGSVKFESGNRGNTPGKIVVRLPEVVNLVTEKVDADYRKIVTGEMSHFDSYLTNVGALRQINATIKRYLDIDVTIAPEDISEIAGAIRELQQ
jgi:hypothetical protein